MSSSSRLQNRAMKSRGLCGSSLSPSSRTRVRYVRPIDLRSTLDFEAISSRVRGTPDCRHEAYSVAATTSSIERPRTRFFVDARRYRTAAFSRTWRGNPIFEAIVLISVRPWARERHPLLDVQIRYAD